MTKDFPNLKEADFDTLTPPEAELFARWLIREFGATETALKKYQTDYGQTEHDLEVAMATTRFNLGGEKREEGGKAYTEQDRKDKALIDNQVLAQELSILKVQVEIGKGHVNILKAQSDLVRSVMVSVRTSMETERGPN